MAFSLGRDQRTIGRRPPESDREGVRRRDQSPLMTFQAEERRPGPQEAHVSGHGPS
ncbi:MAG: hypothetical protein MZV63_64685 [Marinilabiliales bacterium]|nr:hypothetical protein [Marinilabiliales bacterium]